jgi:hypothetical protein
MSTENRKIKYPYSRCSSLFQNLDIPHLIPTAQRFNVSTGDRAGAAAAGGLFCWQRRQRVHGTQATGGAPCSHDAVTLMSVMCVMWRENDLSAGPGGNWSNWPNLKQSSGTIQLKAGPLNTVEYHFKNGALTFEYAETRVRGRLGEE